MSRKPLYISDDINDLQDVEIDPSVDLIASKGLDIDGTGTKIITDDGAGNMTFEDAVAGGPYSLSDLLGTEGIGLGRIVPVWFFSGGQATNTWLNFIGQAVSSDSTPYIATFDMEIFAFSYSNSNDNSDTDIEIYKNGITITELAQTIQVRNSRAAWNNALTTPIPINAGDRISVYLNDQGVNAQNAVVNLLSRTTSTTESSGTIASY